MKIIDWNDNLIKMESENVCVSICRERTQENILFQQRAYYVKHKCLGFVYTYKSWFMKLSIF